VTSIIDLKDRTIIVFGGNQNFNPSENITNFTFNFSLKKKRASDIKRESPLNSKENSSKKSSSGSGEKEEGCLKEKIVQNLGKYSP
jgi:hypothetical protein